MTSERANSGVFRYPPATRKFIAIVSSAGIAALTLTMVFSGTDLASGLQTLLFLAALAVVGNLEILTHKITIDDVAITEQAFFSSKTLKFAEVEDFVDSQRFLLLTGGRGLQRIGLVRGEYGFSLEPFEELRQSIIRKLQGTLMERWRQISLDKERIYPPSGFSIGQSVLYLIPLFFIGLFFVFFQVSEGLFGGAELFFLTISICAVGIFFVRDFRKASRRIIIRKDGVVETNGHSRSVRWEDVKQVIVREPIMFGYGMVEIVGAGGRKIKISRRIKGCGELLFILMNKIRATTLQSFEW